MASSCDDLPLKVHPPKEKYLLMNVSQNIKDRLRIFYQKVKRLEGDPHFIALGFAIGVFVGMTPTIPFHTVLAVVLAFLFKGSKAAAAIGVWFSNPVTIPLFYFLSYRVGTFFFNLTPFDARPHTVLELMKMGTDLTVAMVSGGMILGILPGVAAYWFARWFVIRRHRSETTGASPSDHG